MNENKNTTNNDQNSNDNVVSIMEKVLWTIKEASMATGIGLNTIRRMTGGNSRRVLTRRPKGILKDTRKVLGIYQSGIFCVIWEK